MRTKFIPINVFKLFPKRKNLIIRDDSGSIRLLKTVLTNTADIRSGSYLVNTKIPKLNGSEWRPRVPSLSRQLPVR